MRYAILLCLWCSACGTDTAKPVAETDCNGFLETPGFEVNFHLAEYTNGSTRATCRAVFEGVAAEASNLWASDSLEGCVIPLTFEGRPPASLHFIRTAQNRARVTFIDEDPDTTVDPTATLICKRIGLHGQAPEHPADL